MGGGGTKIAVPSPPPTPPEMLEQARMQTELMRALMPTQEDLAAQRAMTQRANQYLQQFEPFLTPEAIQQREQQQIGLMIGQVDEDTQRRIRDAVERANRYGIDPARTIGEIERGAGVTSQSIRAGGGLERALALMGMGEAARQSQIQGLGMASQLAWSPYARTTGPAASSAGAVADFGQRNYQNALQLAQLQAQLAGMAGQGKMGIAQGIGSGLGAIGSVMGGLGALGWAPLALSSRQYKTGIRPLGSSGERKALSEVLATRPVHFRYKWDKETPRTGLIAEEAPSSMATLDRKAIDIPNTLGTVLAAMKAQQEDIKAVRQEIAEVKDANIQNT